MKNNKIIDKLDKEKLIDDGNKFKKEKLKYNPIFITCVILLCFMIMFAIGNYNDTTCVIIGIVSSLLLSIPTIILNKKLTKINDEIFNLEYYIKNIDIIETNENYERRMLELYAKKEIQEQTQQSKYHIKSKTITDNEKYFLDIIKKHFAKDYEIRLQVPLSSVIEKDKDFENQYQNELNRIIDIGIFDKDTSYPLLLIEINDSTHHKKDRQVRDAKVKDICDQANLKLIAFWTEYSNTEQYIIERVSKNLGKDS